MTAGSIRGGGHAHGEGSNGSGDSVQSRASPGDCAEFVDDMDLILAVSACPVGDCVVPMSEPDRITARPLAFEIYDTH
jgi:uncharacterized protein YcgI (DUF1989 family)